MTAATHHEVDWMGGHVPSNWDVFKLKHILVEEPKEIGGSAPAGAISFGEVVFKDFNNDETLATYRAVRPGQFLINPLNLNYDLKSLRIGLSEIECRVSPAYIVVSNVRKYSDANYLRWALRVFDIQHIKTLGAGVRQTVTFEDVGECLIALPNLDEQARVAAYLQRTTTHIETLIAKKSRFIDLLRERRRALITRVVTRGLDEDAPTKHSGVEWFGNVPANWTVTPFRLAAWFQEGPGIMAADFKETGVPLLRVSGVQGQFATLAGCNFLDPSKVAVRWDHFKTELGDLLISASATTGTISEVGEETVGCVPYTGIIRLKNTSRSTKGFLKAFLGSQAFFEQINQFKSGSTIQHFGPTHLSQMRIALPPIDEQQVIVAYLARATARIDTLIAKTERTIGLLREHHAALITAAVTGKIDLRDAA